MGRSGIRGRARRHWTLPFALIAALSSLGATSLSSQDRKDLGAALDALHVGGMAGISISVTREGQPIGPADCNKSGYTVKGVVEHPFIGYVAWIEWAVKNGIVEYRTLPTFKGPAGLVTPRCPFAVEQQVLSDYRLLWQPNERRLRTNLAQLSMSREKLTQSVSTVGGVPTVPTFDFEFEITGASQWPGITITPSGARSHVRFIRNPKTKKIEVVKSDVHWPTIKLDR